MLYSRARVIRRSVSLVLALSALCSPVRGAAPVPSAIAPLRLSSCQLEDTARVGVVSAECGTLSVLENPADPGGRRILLEVARVPAISRRKLPDPLFVLAGGPGMAATSFYASGAAFFERLHRDRDIVLVDQRGTGRSNALTCALDDSDLSRATDAQITAEAKRCLESLTPKANVQYYTTSLAVRDLDAVRAALGYERINLYGVSYGTRVAQHYIRRFPDHVRSVILDGVVPPQLAIGPAVSVNAERALGRILDRCAQEGACREQFGDPHEMYRSLRAALDTRPVPMTLADPTGGAPVKLDFGSFHLAMVLRLSSYTAEQAALLPLMLHTAMAGDLNPLATQFLLNNRSYGDALAYGMHNSVVCSEDVPFYDLPQVNRAQLEKTYLGTAQLDGLRDICAVWPRGPVDDDFHAPLSSKVPALLLSGSADPITPPEDAERARAGFSDSVHVVLNGFGHGQLTAPCVDKIMTAFVTAATTRALDVSCTRNDKPMPFFTSLGGPAP